MSASGSRLKDSVVRVTAVTVSSESTRKPGRRVTSGPELVVGDQQFELICDEDGKFRQEFPDPIVLSSDIRASLRHRGSWPLWKRNQTLDIQGLLASIQGSPTQDLSLLQDGIRVTFSCQATETIPTPPASSSAESRSLLPTTQVILGNCPKFRILVIGKSGVGKSSLIRTAFGIEQARSADVQRGHANIEEGLVSPVNERFILHDSVGFEPGDLGNYDTVEKFIRSRQTLPPQEWLHIVWFCIQAPYAGGRLLEAAAEDFFRSKEQTMGSIPLIVVFTKFDACVDALTMQLATSSPGQSDEQTTNEARLQVESDMRRRCSEITGLTGKRGPLPHAVVSTEEEYRYTLQRLLDLTDQMVGSSSTPEAQVVSRMAQRIDPRLKIRGSITVGRQRYWKALRTSPHFEGHTIWECLSVIHADIIAVWNFNDPARRLLDREFKELVINLVHEMEAPPPEDPSKAFTLVSNSLKCAVSTTVVAIHSPLAPIILPVALGVFIVAWLQKVYQNVKNVQQIFMAFIVDLTHILETLFILIAPNHHKLTRRAIKLAYSIYCDSEVKSHAHAQIRAYDDVGGPDAALNMIESLINPKEGGGSHVDDYYAGVHKKDIQKLKLDEEEDW